MKIDRKGNCELFITNSRVLFGNKSQLWDVECNKIEFIERSFVPMFSWWWQILFIPMALIMSQELILFAFFTLLAIARQYIRIEALTIGTATKKWLLSKDDDTLDDIARNLRLNTVVGLKRLDGKQIIDAESLDDEPGVPVTLIGENESGPLKVAWSSAIFAFMMYYLGTFNIDTRFWTFLFAATAFCFFIIHRDRKKSNEYRDVKPVAGFIRQGWYFILTKLGIEIIEAKWSFRLFRTNIKARHAGYLICSSILFLGLFLTVINSHMLPLLFGISIGLPIYLVGRALAGIPRSGKRMALRTVTCFVIAIIIVLPCLALMPLYDSATVKLPEIFIQGDSGNGWKNAMSQSEEYGLGFASTSFSLYFDDGEDSEGENDGYPAMLFVIAIKIPIDLDEKDALDELDRQFHEMSIEQEIELDTHIEDGQRMTKQGYATQYIIYNGTAKSERIGFEDIGHNVTKGAETLYIGEVWKAPEYNLLVVSMGIAVISNEELNDQTGIVFIDDWINENVPNPNDSTNTKNWEELYELIPEIVCIGQN